VYAAAALLSVGLGLATRNTAGGLVSALALMLVLPLLLALLGFDWTQRLAELMPTTGAFYLLVGEGPGDPTAALTAESAHPMLGCWALTGMVAGGWRLLRADADRQRLIAHTDRYLPARADHGRRR
jgi:ABC-2 type transport system permease protein